MLECGDCHKCCEGNLVGEAFGKPFYQGHPCFFLKNASCLVYLERPEACRKYQCGWSQGIFGDRLFPLDCGFLVSVETDSYQRQFLKVVIFSETKPEDIEYLKNWCDTNSTYLVMIKNEGKKHG